MGVKPKEFRYAVDLEEGGGVRTEDGTPLGPGSEWTPEHLLLAGLVQCSVKSLGHHATRAGIEVTRATGSASTLFTKRESDGRYAVAEATVALDVGLVPEPGADELVELLQKAERDCFIGASLTVKPTYVWNVS